MDFTNVKKMTINGKVVQSITIDGETAFSDEKSSDEEYDTPL